MRKTILWMVIIVTVGTTLLHLLRTGPLFFVADDYWYSLAGNIIFYGTILYFFRGVAYLLDRLGKFVSRHNK